MTKLILYYHSYSYFSQKVLIALHEKGIPFEGIVVDVTKGEQYSDNFLDLNPRGEVPVLIDGDIVIPDSSRILDYIEYHYSNKDYKPLLNISLEDLKLVKKIKYFRDLIDDIPVGFITLGSLFHADYCAAKNWPFIHPIRLFIKLSDQYRAQTLRDVAQRHPRAKAILMYKAEIQERKQAILQNRTDYIKILEKVSEILETVEKELSQRGNDEWLCTKQFTIADVHLAAFLQRLYVLGLSDTFWSENKRPLVQSYYTRVKQRDSFKKSMPTVVDHFKIVALNLPLEYYAVATTTTLASAIIIYMMKKFIF